MKKRNLILAATALLLGATPLTQAAERHVDISVDLGYYLPAHLRYVRESAPVVIAPPIPYVYYRPVLAPPERVYYRDHYRGHRHGWRHHREQRYAYRQGYRDGRDENERDDRGGRHDRHDHD
jgi:hypothetical protein